MNIINLFGEYGITLIVSLCVTFWFANKQWRYYRQNLLKLSALEHFFLLDKKGYHITSKDEVCLIQSVDQKSHSPLSELIQEINLYVQKSIGTADFNIIQNKTDRCVESMCEHATAELSFPTYYGLMGTFTGTFIGLIGFLLSGSDLSDESKVTNLIIGVLVSMATSLFGLVLTTKSNHIAASAKKKLDEQKNEFLDFIQLELIPKLQTTITTLQQTMEGFVPKFDVVIKNFESTFTGVIGRFKETFDQCTDNFGSEFRENSTLISQTVSSLNESISKITTNVENQRLLLEELRSEKMFDTLQQFVDSAETFKTSSKAIDKYNELLQSLMFTTQAVIDKQTEYVQSLQIPRELVLKLMTLLDRISTFEQSVNALGENIAQAEMLGNKEMALIARHLESLEEKKQLADRFLDTSNEELEAIFKQQEKTVKTLFNNYQQQLEEERDELSNFVRETLQIISKKKTDLLNHLENAFDVSRVNAMFSHLKTLPEIMAKLDEMETAFVHGEQLKQHIKELLSGLVQVQGGIRELSSEQIQAISDGWQQLSSSLHDISEQHQNNQDAWMRELIGQHTGTQTGIIALRESVDSGLKAVLNDVQNTSVHLEQQLRRTSQDVQEGLAQVSDGTKYLRRDIVKDVSTNLTTELRKVNTNIQEQGRNTERLIRSTNEQTLAVVRQLSAEERKALAGIIDAIGNSGQTIHSILESLKQSGA